MASGVDSAGRRLRRKIGLSLPYVLAAGRRLLDHPRAAELYPEYLFATHCVIRASVPLMEAAAAQARRDLGDRVAALLADYLDEHIPEERDHDEWLLEDLELLGLPRSAILERPPPARVAALVGAQYYWIHHYHPVALLGYIALLEGYPPDPAAIEDLIERTGYPRAAFRTLLAHAELDPGHAAELDELVERLPLDDRQAALLGLSATSTASGLVGLFDDVVRSVDGARRARA